MKSIPELIYDTRRNDDQRSYLGASSIGYHCDRRLWMAFRWCARPEFDGRMIRLFNRGHREEEIFISELKRICSGAVMADDPNTGKQFGFEALNGHIQCHLDGVAFGIPMDGIDKEQAHLLEFKTLSDKSFRDLESKGLAESKPVYYAQIQLCMHLAELEACLFLAVNKNNDELYAERIEYNQDFAADIMNRGERIVFAVSPPDRIGSPAWYECKFCPMYNTCHNGIIPDVNCRTCCHSTPLANGTWHCAKHARTISRDEQIVGCGNHIYHPELIDAELVDGSPDYAIYRDRNGNIIANGAYIPKSDSDEVFIFDSKAMEGKHIDTICNNRVRQAAEMAR